MTSSSSPASSSSLQTPLLPELSSHPTRKPTASLAGAVFNISTSIVGAGIMSIPAAFRVLGVLPGMGMILVVAFLADKSAEFLLRYSEAADGESPEAWSYAGAMGAAFGKFGAALLQMFISATTVGTLIVYLIIIGDVMSGSKIEGVVHLGVLQQWFGEQWWNERWIVLLFTAVAVILPLVLLRRVDSLRFTSAVSVLLAVVFVCISTGMAVFAFFAGTTQTPRMLPDLDHLSSFFELFTAVPIIVVAYTFHFNVHPIRAELSKTSDMIVAVRISVLLCSVIYAAIGFFGYLLFGESTMADVLSNFDHNSGSPIGSIFDDIVRLSYVFHLVLVFPLLFYSLRINIDGLLFPKSRVLSSDSLRFMSLTGVMLLLIYLATIAIPTIWAVFQFSGSTTAVCISLIFPGALVLRDIEGISKRKDRTLAATMIALAVMTSSIAIASNITSTLGG